MPVRDKSSPQMGEELQGRLQRLLPQASQEVLETLTRMVLHPGQESPKEVIRQLLEQGSDAADVQQALGEARDFALDTLLPTVMPQDNPEMMKIVHAFLAHGDRLQKGLVEALDERHEAGLRKLHSQLVSEGQAHLITKASHVWQQSKGITLYNYYQEMRISAYMPLYKVEGHGMVTGRSRDLVPVVAAGEHGHVVHVLLPESDFCLRLIAEEATASTVHWRFGGLIEASREKRREVRVQVDSPTFITLRLGDRQWRGRVEEFSSHGLGVLLPLSAGLYQGQKIDFTLIMHMNEMDGSATIRWLNPNGSGARIGLEIDFDPHIELYLEEQVERRHRAIINELRLKGVPDVLA